MHHDLIGHTSFAKSAPPCDRFVFLPKICFYPRAPSAHRSPRPAFSLRSLALSLHALFEFWARTYMCGLREKDTRPPGFFACTFRLFGLCSWENYMWVARKVALFRMARAHGAPCSLILWRAALLLVDLSYVNESFYRILGINSCYSLGKALSLNLIY